MRIVHLTPGTGSFHCGGCLRDHGLVTALRRLGHDAVMAPMYLPLVLDEPLAPPDQLPTLFGGVNVYLQQKSALFRHTPGWLDRWLNSDWLLRMAGRRAGMTSPRELGEITLSMLRGSDGRQAKEVDKLVEWLTTGGKPDVVCLSNALLVGLAGAVTERLAVPVICSLQGEDSFLDGLPEPYRQQAWDELSRRARQVMMIAPSEYYGQLMQRRLSLEPNRLRVIHNGVGPELIAALRAQPAAPRTAPTLGYLARLCRLKGLHTLVEAFILLHRQPRHAELRLHAAGAMTAADVAFLDEMRKRLAREGLERLAVFEPNVDTAAKVAMLRGIDVFSVPATYGEAFGLYLIEAMAAGVPVVQPRHASFPELIERSGAGVLCAPDDANSLAEAIDQVLGNPAEMSAMSEAGRAAAATHFNTERMAREFSDTCELVSELRTSKKL